MPLHLLPSSLSSQSLSVLQAQVFAPPRHLPALHASLLVHGVPSLQAVMSSAAGWATHLPSLGRHFTDRHVVLSTVWQLITVAGLCLQVLVDLSQ